MSSENRESFISSFQTSLFFSLLPYYKWLELQVLHWLTVVRADILTLFLILEEKLIKKVIFQLNIMLIVGLLLCRCSLTSKIFFSSFFFLRAFFLPWIDFEFCQIIFSILSNMIIWFFFFNLLIWWFTRIDFVCWFSFESLDKAHLIMVYNSFHTFDSVIICWIYLYLNLWYWSVVLFCVLFWFSHQGNFILVKIMQYFY